MLRTTISAVVLSSAALFSPIANAAMVSTATIEGGAVYSSAGNLSLGQIENLLAVDFDANSPVAQHVITELGNTGYNLGLYASVTDLDINLPGVNQPARWNLGIDFSFDVDYRLAGSQTIETFTFNFSDSGEILPFAFSVNDASAALGGPTFANLAQLEIAALGLLSTLPEFTDFGFGALLLSDEVLPDPSLVLLLQADPLPFLRNNFGLPIPAVTGALADFRADITLTAVDEPATLALLGLGLVGVGFMQRRQPK